MFLNQKEFIMNKTVYNTLLVTGTVLFVAGAAGTILKRLWKS